MVVDAHNDLLMAVHRRISDPDYFRRSWLPQLRRGGVGLQILPVFVDAKWLPEAALRMTFQLVEVALRTIERCGDELALCLGPGDAEAALASGRIGIFLALEGCPAVGQDVEVLRTLFRLGVRVASLTHFGRNSLADGSAEEATGGQLTRLGLQAVELMQELGMLLDVSHLSMVGTAQVLKTAGGPVIASHSSCYEVQPHHRNLPDALLAAIGERGGVVGINFFPTFLGTGPVSIETVVDHIQHAMRVAGSEHVGLGPDFTKEVAAEMDPRDLMTEGCELGDSVPGLSGPGDFWVLEEALLRRGLSRIEVEAVMGGNFLRLLNTQVGATGAAPPFVDLSPGTGGTAA